MHHRTADTSLQSVGIHWPLHTASGRIIRILDYFSSFVPQNLTSINMTTPAEKGRRNSLQLRHGGWCDVGRRGREEREGGREGADKVLMSHAALELTHTTLVLVVAAITHCLVLNLE